MRAPRTTVLILACAALLAGTAPAWASEAIAKRAACVACHAVDAKGIGPSFRDIARKHKGNAGAAALLEQRVRKGSVGVWGPLPMAATSPAVLNDADLKAVVAWVLTLAN
jgi:cytochrome c